MKNLNKAIAKAKSTVYDFDYNMKKATYETEHYYSNPFNISFEKLGTNFTKGLTTNKVIKKDVMFADEMLDFVQNKFNMSLVELGDICNKKVLDFYYNELQFKHKEAFNRKIENVNKLIKWYEVTEFKEKLEKKYPEKGITTKKMKI